MPPRLWGTLGLPLSLPQQSEVRLLQVVVLASLLFQFAATAGAAAPACPARPAGRFTVTAVVDGATLALNDGSLVRIAGILQPTAPASDHVIAGGEWPPLQAATAALERLVIGKTVALAERTPKKDRYGRLRTDLLLIGETPPLSIAVQIVRGGHARVYLFDKDRVCADALFAAEAAARREAVGLWQLEAYRWRPSSRPREIASLAGQLVIVEGRVLDVGESHGRNYLNFGSRWREDLTLVISRRLSTRFRKLGIDIGGLGGKRVRVRGFVAVDRGPLIRLTAVDHLEFIDAAPRLSQPQLQMQTGDGLIEVSAPPVEVDDPEDRDQ